MDVHIQSITGAIGEWFQVEGSKKQRILRAQSFSPEKPFSLFDGASQSGQEKGGTGMLL